MCLESVRFNEVGIGYKVFNIEHELRSVYYSLGQEKFPRKKWITDIKEGKIKGDDGNFYGVGFHIFLNKDDAQDFKGVSSSLKVFEVKFKEVVSMGKQKSNNRDYTVITRKMMILEEV